MGTGDYDLSMNASHIYLKPGNCPGKGKRSYLENSQDLTVTLFILELTG